VSRPSPERLAELRSLVKKPQVHCHPRRDGVQEAGDRWLHHRSQRRMRVPRSGSYSHLGGRARCGTWIARWSWR
jgi:hypothetical protein